MIGYIRSFPAFDIFLPLRMLQCRETRSGGVAGTLQALESNFLIWKVKRKIRVSLQMKELALFRTCIALGGEGLWEENTPPLPPTASQHTQQGCHRAVPLKLAFGPVTSVGVCDVVSVLLGVKVC